MAYNNEYVHKLLKIELFLFPSLPCVCCNSAVTNAALHVG